MRASTTAGSARVEVSPKSSSLPSAIFFRMRLHAHDHMLDATRPGHAKGIYQLHNLQIASRIHMLSSMIARAARPDMAAQIASCIWKISFVFH